MTKHPHFTPTRRVVAVIAAAAVLLCQSVPAAAVTAAGTSSSGSAPLASTAIPSSHVPLPAGSEAQSIRVTEVSGVVEVREASSDVWRAVVAGDTLKPSDTVRTGETGTARIEFDGKIRMQLLNASELTIEEARQDSGRTRQTLLRLDIGKIKADVDKLGPDSSFKVKTPTAVSAVRGTTFYLSVVRFAQGLAGIVTDLYVDKGRVDFSGIGDEVNALFVEAFHASSAGGDGRASEPKELTPEEREALIDAFENAFKSLGGNPQAGVESGPLPGGPAGAFPPAGDGGNRDALERLIQDLVDLRDENSGIEDEDALDGILDDLDGLVLIALKSEARSAILNGALEASDPASVVQAIADLQAIRDAEKQDLRDALDSILDKQEFLSEDAQQEKEFDAQTGKVFTDVHGNRVRTDQYVYHEPGSDLVRLVSLTLRTGDYQPGITSLEFGARFNTGIDPETSLKDLPWRDYLNVVTQEEYDERFYDSYEGTEGSGQFIIHEMNGSGDAPSLYPTEFFAEFRNPEGDSIKFTETYSDPYEADFITGDVYSEDPELVALWAQGRIGELTRIMGAGWGSAIEYGTGPGSPGNTSDVTLINGAEGSQSGDLSEASALVEQLSSGGAADLFKDLPVNEDGNPLNDLHPAYFQDTLDVDGDIFRLQGYFLPIDNLGQVLPAAGFRVQGIRDLVNPNSLVVGGQYNLEAIFLFGEQGEGGFSEHFRIDAIITPEIFAPYGTGLGGQLFPDNFVEDDDDQGGPVCEFSCD